MNLKEDQQRLWCFALAGATGFALTLSTMMSPDTALASGEIIKPFPQCGRTVGLEEYNPNHTIMVNKIRGVENDEIYTRFKVVEDMGDLGQCPQKKPIKRISLKNEDLIDVTIRCFEGKINFSARLENGVAELFSKGLRLWYVIRDIAGKEKWDLEQTPSLIEGRVYRVEVYKKLPPKWGNLIAERNFIPYCN